MFRIYFNLHKKCWSIQQRIKGRGWLVIDHADTLHIPHGRFHFSEAGRERVRREGRKNVHAFIVCDEYDKVWGGIAAGPVRISYNPYNDLGFHVTPVTEWTPRHLFEACDMLLAGRNVSAHAVEGVCNPGLDTLCNPVL
jgi:hypothetical protein